MPFRPTRTASAPRRLPRLATVLAAGLLAGAAALSGTPAGAAASDWAASEGGRVRLVALPPEADGTIRAALQIDLRPGWKTYWRDPGETGIPPQLDLDGSTNVAGKQMLYPVPVAVDDGYSVWAGYTEPVLLPILIRQDQAGAGSAIAARAFLGICETICIPFQASFALTVAPGRPATEEERRTVAAAFEALPEPPGRDFAVSAARLAATEEELFVAVTLPSLRPSDDRPALFVAGPEGWTLGPGTLVAIEGDTARFAVPVRAGPKGTGLSGRTVAVAVRSGLRTMAGEVEVE